MVDLQGDGNGQRQLQARLLWFRTDHPEAEIETELVVAEEEMAVCRATLRTASAGGASGHGMALREEFGSFYVETAEDRALSRALTALGYGIAPLETDQDVDESAYPQIPPINLVSARSLLREEPEFEDEDEPGPPPQPIRQPAAEPAQQRESPDEGDNSADVSWNKFWTWARQRGYSSAKELNEILGVENVNAYTPLEVRQMLKKYELDNPPGGHEE